MPSLSQESKENLITTDKTTQINSISENTLPTQEKNESGEDSSNLNSPIFDQEDKDVLIIKGKFRFDGAGLYGIFAVLLFNNNPNEEDHSEEHFKNPFLDLKLLVSYFSDILHINISEPWFTLEETFNQIQIKGEYAESVTTIFKKGSNEYFNDGGIYSSTLIADYQKKRNGKETIHKSLEDIFSHIYQDRQVSIELEFEEVSSATIVSLKNFRIAKETPETNKGTLDVPFITLNSNDFLIPANPYLAPVQDGVTAKDLEKGMRLLMKVDKNSEYGQHWIHQYNLYQEKFDTYLPLVGTVEQIGPIIKHSLDILVSYQKNQYTKFNIESNIKLKIFNDTFTEKFVDPLQVNFNPITAPKYTDWPSLFTDPSFKLMVWIVFSLTLLALIALYIS